MAVQYATTTGTALGTPLPGTPAQSMQVPGVPYNPNVTYNPGTGDNFVSGDYYDMLAGMPSTSGNSPTSQTPASGSTLTNPFYNNGQPIPGGTVLSNGITMPATGYYNPSVTGTSPGYDLPGFIPETPIASSSAVTSPSAISVGSISSNENPISPVIPNNTTPPATSSIPQQMAPTGAPSELNTALGSLNDSLGGSSSQGSGSTAGGAQVYNPATGTYDTYSAPAPITAPNYGGSGTTNQPSTLSSAQGGPAPLDTSILSTVPPLQATPSEMAAQGENTYLQTLNAQMASKSAYETNAYNSLGYGVSMDAQGNITATDPVTTELNTQLTMLQNQAQAIPLQMLNAAQGQGDTTGGIDSIQAAALRNNAVQSLNISSLIAARQGSFAIAQMQVQNAVTAKYGPIQDQITALTANLNLIQNSPEYSLEEQNRAQAQTLLLNEVGAQLDVEKTEYEGAQSEVLNYASVASAQQLMAMQQATTPAQVDAIAASLGLNKPVAGRYKTSIASVTDATGTHNVIVTTDTITGAQVGAPKPYSGSAQPGSTIGTSSTPPTGFSQTQNGPNQPVQPTPQNGGGASTGQGSNPVPSASSPSGFSTQVGSGPAHLLLSEYGLLANTDFNPNSTAPAPNSDGLTQGQVDQAALTYITQTLQTGVLGGTSTQRSTTSNPLSTQIAISQRANQLYQAATGHSLTGTNAPLIGGSSGAISQLAKNNTLLTNLNNQIGTVTKNMGLSLSNIDKAGVNQLAPAINALINPVAEALGYADVSTYLAQNNTIQNELGSLLAVKNQGGTTVADKLAAGDLLPSDLSATQQQQILTTLMQEAQNQQQSIGQTNAGLYKQIDPLMQDPNNPARTQLMNAQFVESTLKAGGYNYNSLMSEMQSQAPAGQQPAIDAETGAIGFATPAAIASGAYIPL